MKPWLRDCWRGARFCASCALDLVHWSLWLVLLVALGAQLYVLTAQQMTVPAFVLRRLTAELAASGFNLGVGETSFDPRGRVLLRQVRLNAVTLDEPVVVADSVYLQLDPWFLVVGEVRIDRVSVSELNLLIPAMLSPAGVQGTLVSDLDADLRFDDSGRNIRIDKLDARIGSAELAVVGGISLPRAESSARLDYAQIATAYLRLARAAGPQVERTRFLTHPRLTVVLDPDPGAIARVDATLLADEVELPPDTGGRVGAVSAATVSLHTSLPLIPPDRLPLRVRLEARSLSVPGRGEADIVEAVLDGVLARNPWTFSPAGLRLSARQIETAEIPAENVVLTFSPTEPGQVRVDGSTRLAGAGWGGSLDLDLATGAGDLAAEGRLPLSLLTGLAARQGLDLSPLLQYEQAPAVRLETHLGEGGRPVSAHGSVVTGPLVARRVALDAFRARFAWSGTEMRADEIEMRTPGSIARGSYVMDTSTLDFRFLLEGSLQPADIDGWFREWWPNFWTNFDFSTGPPAAEVDIQGRWGIPTATRLFVAAAGQGLALRDIPLDRLRTRLFIRPGFVDALDFQVVRPDGTADGAFTRSFDREGGKLQSMRFDVRSDLPLPIAAELAGDNLLPVVEPFDFESPPALRISGELRGPDRPLSEQRRMVIDATSSGPMTFFKFPLSDVRAKATVDGDNVMVGELSARFAQGELSGHADLDEMSDARRLGFDAILSGAVLGEAIQTVEDYSAARDGREAQPQSRFQQRIAAGRLDLALSAEGTANDPYSFEGMGNARVSGADLGEINLLGVLSALLRRTLLNYSTLQLDTARANFDLHGREVAFSEVVLTGPRASVEARGSYFLDSKTVNFTTRVNPFEESRSLIGSAVDAVLSPLSQVLEVRLTGQLERPSWSFVLGPTNILRSIIGADSTVNPGPSSVPPPGPSGSPDSGQNDPERRK